jgi:hypothetical protein
MNNEDRSDEANVARLLQTTLGGEARLSQGMRSHVLQNIVVRNRIRFQPREFPSLIIVCLALLTEFSPIFLTRAVYSESYLMNDTYFAPLLIIFVMNLICIPIASVILFLRRKYHEAHI